MVLVPSINLVARIGVDVTHRSRLAQELRVARWLKAKDVSTAQPAVDGPCPQLTETGGRVVTWWEYLPSAVFATLSQLMAALRTMHGVRGPFPQVAHFDPWARVAHQLAAATGLPSTDLQRLHRHWGTLRASWDSSRWPHEPRVVIHGDAHTRNTLVFQGKVHLLDLEDTRLGPWQWDLTTPLVHLRLGWIDEVDYHNAVVGYGLDPSGQAEIDVLIAIRLFRMTCWLASRTGREPQIVPMVQQRIASLEDHRLLTQWSPG